jgi:hypothetical protein
MLERLQRAMNQRNGSVKIVRQGLSQVSRSLGSGKGHLDTRGSRVGVIWMRRLREALQIR